MVDRSVDSAPFNGAVSNPRMQFRIPAPAIELIEQALSLSIAVLGHRRNRGQAIISACVSHLDLLERVLLLGSHKPRTRARLAEARRIRTDLLAIIEDGKRIVRTPYSPDAIAASDVPTGPTAQPGYRPSEPGSSPPRSTYAP